MIQKTTLPEVKKVEAERKWHFLDAKDQVLGRLSTRIAVLLAGKHKRIYTPSMDCGDFVVVTNASGVRLTGSKAEEKFYFSHSGYAGGAKTVPYKRQMENDPTKVVMLAVKRMLDDNKLRARRLKRLKIYPGAEHGFAGLEKSNNDERINK